MEENLSWVSHPFVEDYPRSIFSIIVIIFLPLLVLLSFQDIYLTLFSFFVLAISLVKYFFATSYTLGPTHLLIRFFGKEFKKQWSYYKTYQIDKKGIYLSPYKKGTIKWNFTGTFLRFRNNREAVIRFIKEKLEQGEKVGA